MNSTQSGHKLSIQTSITGIAEVVNEMLKNKRRIEMLMDEEEFNAVNEYSTAVEIIMSDRFTEINGIGQQLFEILNPYISKISVTYINKVLKIRMRKEENWVKDLGVIIECISLLYKKHKKDKHVEIR